MAWISLNLSCVSRCFPGTNFNWYFIIFICSAIFILVLIIVVETRHANDNEKVSTELSKWNPKFRRKGSLSMDEPTDTSDPTLQYGVVIDCGSSGSRVFVYFWSKHSGDPQDLLYIQPMKDQFSKPVMKKIEPGLSEFVDKPEQASNYMRPLLQFAADRIPKHHHKETHLYILATAGLRLLSTEQQDMLLNDLREDISKEFDFLVAENHFEVITGKQEGVYSWIAINYVLDKFMHGDDITNVPLVPVEVSDESSKLHVRRRTVGVLDMGGASVQIAYEVPQSVRFASPKEDLAKSLLAEFSLGCQNYDLEHTYRVYVTTFLGYGTNEARERYEDLILAKLQNDSSINVALSIGSSSSYPLLDPCYPVNFSYTLAEKSGKAVHLRGTGDYNTCRETLIPLLNLNTPCLKSPCSMNGVYQPTINFYNSEFFGFSEFWYTTEDVFGMGGPYSAAKFDQIATQFCASPWSSLESRYEKKLYPKSDERRLRQQCFKSAWMSTVLHEGFRFPRDFSKFNTAQSVIGKEVQWTLGALIHRTRYLPIREVEKLEENESHSSSSWSNFSVNNFFFNQYIFVFCIIIVAASIFLYMQRLRLCPRKVISLHRVPSMSYFMTDPLDEQPMLNVFS